MIQELEARGLGDKVGEEPTKDRVVHLLKKDMSGN